MATVLEQFSCENASEATFTASIVGPIRSLLGMSKHESLFIYAWIVLLIIYLLLYFVVPISFLNSSNGFRNGWITLVWTLVIFFIMGIVYILWTRESACKSKLIKSSYYVYGRKPAQPTYLSQAVERVQSLPGNRNRPVSRWEAQSVPITTLE
jgi:hypothetical protein